ncbi:MAG: hypothetical protein HC828_04850 [Blastochloris sp.]|nr:hypothetical protein [Blastochloris sp.]
MEEARWMHEARMQAAEGEWHMFLTATHTGEDTSERLINVHRLAERHPLFAELVRRGTFSFSVAWRLARPNVPPLVVDAACQSDEVLTVTAINQAIRDAKYVMVDGESPPRGGLLSDSAPIGSRSVPALAPLALMSNSRSLRWWIVWMRIRMNRSSSHRMIWPS